jgi:hypothetical protein
MLRTLVIIGLLAITPFAIGCSSEDGAAGSGGSAGCNQQCEDGATCTFTCEGGTCVQVCDVAGGSTCDFSCTPDNNCT